MWAFIIVLVLICGYYYVDTHLPSKYKLNKSVGWSAYFCVGAKGVEFLIAGIILAVIFVFYLYFLMFVLNILHYFGVEYKPFTFASDFLSQRILGISAFSALCLSFTIFVSIKRTAQVRKLNSDLENRIEYFREIAKDSSIENILLESVDRIDEGLLILVTLKSRKVYVGILDIARFEGMDTNTLVLIPFLSGYRDKDTLTFIIEHNYTEHYREEGITLTSEPLSVYQFRHVLPFEQIESFSLFNFNTYEKFQSKLEKEEDINVDMGK
ncbi:MULTISPECIES: hypothetical protein [Xenorhabdus]|uniref:hypothetical protein n=1 Tax=Xenorhabdus TaxID=626 RepID=UPI00064A4306|nr:MULTISPECIES: hypothetical protein [Xenorhabdus]KLU17447.1 hypothetical protein AAY47_00010 [Xenorhabdus griffiniae]KOP34699.1 hypothetical protein AFK69_03205 [Xenorhabdus sp. GDc328]